MLDKRERQRAKDVILPSSVTLKKLIAVCTTPEAATDLYNRYTKLLDDAKMSGDPAMSGVMSTVRSYVDYVNLATAGGDPWSGKMPSNAFQNFQQGLADIAAEVVSEKQVVFDYAVSDESELLRGYSSGDDPLEDDAVNAMDILFNAWLAQNQMFSKGGIIYEGTPATENPKRVNADTLRNKLGDSETGFGKFADHKSIQLTSHAHEYPKSEQKMPTEETGPSAPAG